MKTKEGSTAGRQRQEGRKEGRKEGGSAEDKKIKKGRIAEDRKTNKGRKKEMTARGRTGRQRTEGRQEGRTEGRKEGRVAAQGGQVRYEYRRKRSTQREWGAGRPEPLSKSLVPLRPGAGGRLGVGGRSV